VDFNKNCSEYTQGKVDSDNVENRYSLRPMTSLWRHICLAKVGASLQHAISQQLIVRIINHHYAEWNLAPVRIHWHRQSTQHHPRPTPVCLVQ